MTEDNVVVVVEQAKGESVTKDARESVSKEHDARESTMSSPEEDLSAPTPRLRDVLGCADTLTRILPADPLTPLDSTDVSKPPLAPSETEASPYIDTSTKKPAGRDIRLSRQVHATFTFIEPEPLPNPVWLGISRSAAELIDVDIEDDDELLSILSGSFVPTQCRPWAHNYAGHQFGFYAGQLGDGRAVSLGEIAIKTVTGDVKERYELQLKGAGRTPYSRFGDGYALVRSSVREFLASEYMAAIGIPTSRALAVIGSSRAVYREAGVEAGGVTARIAPSWIRFGSFELFWYRGERDREDEGDGWYWGWGVAEGFWEAVTTPTGVKVRGKKANDEPEGVKMAEPEKQDERKMSVATRPNLRVAEERTSDGAVQAYVVAPYAVGKQVDVVLNRGCEEDGGVGRSLAGSGLCSWVLNTIYGPFLFLDNYNPLLTNDIGRYRFEHQPRIALWNLSKLGRTLVNIVYDDPEGGETTPDAAVDSLDIIRQILETYEPTFVDKYTEIMRKKLGFRMIKDNDLENIITPLLQLMSDVEVDYTIFLRKLCDFRMNELEFPLEIGPAADASASTTSSLDLSSKLFPEPAMGRRASMAPGATLLGPSTQRRRSSVAEGSAGAPAAVKGTSSGCLEMLIAALNMLAAEVAAEQKEYQIEGIEIKQPKAKKEEDGDSNDEEDDDDEDEEDDDIFAVNLPSELEIKTRWQKWARAYRSRLLLERAASKSQDPMDVDDRNRSARMKKDVVESLETMPELTPKDPEIERMEKEFEEIAKLNADRGRFRRDRPAGEEEEVVEKVVKGASPDGMKTLPRSVEAIERVMKIVVGDVWGDVTETNGWEGKDKAFAQEWAGSAPKSFTVGKEYLLIL
ncbi:hypothetical protein BC829DRAFT_415152 [Chytridium lagenaria]|nr:hypothetical protein BC829DRAFT_415152 [Chytridium lagenaria]